MAGAARKKRVLIVTAGISLAAVSSVLAADADHDCAGEHCEICVRIESARNLIAGLCRGALFRFFAALAGAPLLFKTVSAYPAALLTLVSLNVKSLT